MVARLGWSFEVVIPDVDERVTGTPSGIVRLLSERKARAVAGACERGVVLAADTLVALDGEALGKPVDETDARRMLRALSGRTHEVFTGVCMMNAASGRMALAVERSAVTFREISDIEIDRYIATGEPMDKAGSYGVQGLARAFVARIDGSIENVMGLPIEVLPQMYEQIQAHWEG